MVLADENYGKIIQQAQAWVEIKDVESSERHELLARNDMKHVFGSKNLGPVNDMRNEREIAGAEFEDAKLRIALFDDLIQNLDRSEGNSNILFMADSFQEFKIIDHNDALSREFARRGFDRTAYLSSRLYRGRS